jgi:predicted phosphodiesterase
MYRRHGGRDGAAKLGVNAKTFEARVRIAIERGLLTREDHPVFRKQHSTVRQMEVGAAPDDDLSVNELLALKKSLYERKLAKDKWAQLIPVTVKDRQPIAITVLGDPHVDDDGCDIGALERDLDVPSSTPGMYLLHLGDLTNNWIGRLAKKYADQMTTRSQSYKLVEWVLKGRPNLAVVFGNHDLWQGAELLTYMTRAASTVGQPHGARMELRFPGDRTLRIHTRHDFPGRSQYNAAHGMRRELMFGYMDHILLCGHIHQDAAQIVPNVDGDVSHLYRVSGYKILDDYADENRYIPHRMAPSVTLVLNPWHPVPAERVKPFWCVEHAAEWLTFLRAKKAA